MKWIRYSTGFLLVWVATLYCEGQNNDLVFHHLRVEDGLSQALNWFTYKDSRGFVWISSLAGLNRFDGLHVKLYTPDKSDPSSILGENIQSEFFEDQQGNLWFSVLEGIDKYNWDHDCFDHYQLPNKSGSEKNGYYIFYLDAFQNLWFLQNGIELYTYHIPTGQFTRIGKVPAISIRCSVISDSSGRVSKLLLRGSGWPNIKVVDINAAFGCSEPYDFPFTHQENISTISGSLHERDTVSWLLSKSNLIRYSWVTGEERTVPVHEGNDLVRLNDSILLIGTANDGLLKFNTTNWAFISKQIKKADQPFGLQSNNVRYLTKDQDNTIWVSIDGYGLSYSNIHKKKFHTTFLEDQIAKETKIIPIALFQEGPESLICFTRETGAFLINLADDQVVVQPHALINDKIDGTIFTASKDKFGNYWIGTGSGLFLFIPKKNQITQLTESDLAPLSSQSMPDGSVLFTVSVSGLFKGLALENEPVRFSKVFDMVCDGWPVMLDSKGKIWVNECFQHFRILDSATYKPIATVPINGVNTCIAFSPNVNSIWLAAISGLYEVDASNFNIKRQYNESTGMHAKGISTMIMDDRGVLWLAHYNGIIAFDTKTRKSRDYAKEDGLPSLEFTTASCKLENGEFWFGSVGALTRFFPDSIQDLQVKSIPQITEMLVNDRNPVKGLVCEESGATNITEIKKLTFDYKHNTLTFQVNALEYSAPSLCKVMYKMEGLDEGLISAANGSTVRFPNLQAGTYQFMLYAFNSDGVRNPEPRILVITIKPPFYKTWWFRILVGLIAISIIAYIIYLRFSKALELQKVRLKLYENLHDDVGSRLTAIVLSAEDLERNENIQHPKLHAISQIARSIVGNMRRLVWAIDPENDSMNSLMQKITHDKSTILHDDIEFSFEMEPGLKNNMVPGEVRYQISSICNEAFTNIMKYAKAKNVVVSITRESKWLKLIIKDDGVGFVPDEKTKNALTGSGYGLANMQRRSSRVGGTFKLTSKPNEGTTIEAKFPIS